MLTSTQSNELKYLPLLLSRSGCLTVITVFLCKIFMKLQPIEIKLPHLEKHCFYFQSIDGDNFIRIEQEDDNMFTIHVNDDPIQYFSKETAQALSKFLNK